MQIKKRLFGWSRIGVGCKIPSIKVGRTILLSICALVVAVSSILPNVPNADAALPGAQWSRVSPAAATKQWLDIASSSDGVELVAAAGDDYIYTSIDSGATWTQRAPAGVGVIKRWRTVASSADGTRLVAAADFDNVYTSTDSGATWTPRTPAGVGNNKYWYSVASSADGLTILVGAGADFVYVSTDGGANWTQRAPSGARTYSATAMSADGSKMFVGIDAGYIYVSTDGGATWAQVNPAGIARNWQDIAVSSDGTKLVAVAANDYVYTSEDSGATWTQNIVSGTAQNWMSATSSADGSKLAVGASNNFVFTSTDSGATWTQRDPTGTGAPRSWNGLASSADGAKLAVTASSYYIYTSTDSGATWTQRDPAGSARYWVAMASSADGMRLVAGAQGDYTYTSTDGGTTWTQRRPSGNTTQSWSAYAMSADGMRILAANNQGGSYTSIDGGVTWTERTPNDGAKNWWSAASSADGTRLVLVPTGGQYVRTSTDGGATWTEHASIGGRSWRGAAMSADGNTIAVSAGGGSIYTTTNGGANWTERTSAGTRNWFSLAMSSDGSRMVAGVDGGGYVYTSIDGGATWTQRDPAGGTGSWRGIASSADGMRLVAAATGGYVYTSIDGGATWTQRDPAGGIRNWRSVVSSSSGHRLAAAAGGGGANDYIYISGGTFLPTVDPSEISVSGATVNLTGECSATNDYPFTSVISHESTTHAISFDGVVYSWGSNVNGTFGNGTTADSNVPVAVKTSGVLNGKTVTKLVATNSSVSALASDGTVYSWGHNNYGQLGDGTNNNSNVPVAVGGVLTGKMVLQLVGAGDSVYALASDGKVYSWGRNNYGQLGNNSTVASNVPVAVVTSGVLSGKAVTQIAADGDTAYALAADGAAYSWGHGDHGQLGNGGTVISPVWTQRNPTGTVENWATIDSSADGTKLIAAISNKVTTAVQRSIDGGANWTNISPIPQARNWTSVASSDDGETLAAVVGGSLTNGFVYISTNGGTSWTPRYPLGGTNGANWVSVDVSADGTKIIAAAQGDYIYTSINSGATWTQRNPAGVTKTWYSVSTSADGTKLVAAASGDYVYTSGDSGATWTQRTPAGAGQTRSWRGTASSADGSKIAAVAGAPNYIFISTNSGVNWTQNNAAGNLFWYGVDMSSDGTGIIAGTSGGTTNNDGLGKVLTSANGGTNWTDQTTNGLPTGSFRGVTMSDDGTKMAAVSYGGYVYTYPTVTGGGGVNADSSVPVAVDMTGAMSGKAVSRLTAGGQSAYAVTSDGAIYAWGNGGGGRLGNNAAVDSNVPVAVDMTGAMSGKAARQIVADYSFAFAIATDGTVYSWGSGTLGNGGSSNVPVAVTGALSGKNVTTIISNDKSVYALSQDGSVFAWGNNSAGQIGNNSNVDASTPVAVYNAGALAAKFIVGISAGASQAAYALASDGLLYSWGDNSQGQLGNGTTGGSSNVPVAVTQSSPIANIMINGFAATNIASGDGCTVSFTAPPNNPGTYDVVITYNDGTIVTIPQSLTYVEPYILLYLYGDNLIQANPFTNNGEGTTPLQTTVVTNDVTGYTVSVNSQTSDTNLVCSESGRSSDIVPAMSGSAANLTDDTWAYGLGSSVATPSTWKGMTATPTIFDSYSTDTAGRTHFLYFGAKVTMNTTPCDSYNGDIILTATTNWSSGP